MRRYLLAIVALTCLLPLSTSAQWYLFPGGRPAKDTVKTAVRDSSLADVPVQQLDTLVTDSLAIADTLAVADTLKADSLAVDFTRVALILPFRSTGTPNSNFLDFYCGVLLAADWLGTEERRFAIDVYDSTVGLPTATQIDSADLIIGPVSYDDIEAMLPQTRGKCIISPLDPKVSSLTDRYNIIQAPSGWEYQIDELARWLFIDTRGGDAVVLLQSDSEMVGEMTERLVCKFGDLGVSYEISSDPESWDGKVEGTCRFVLTSENDEFCAACIRQIALMNLRGGHNAVYSTSRLRSVPDLESESLNAAGAYITATYYADPGDADVRHFSERYRTLFKGEPGQWAFQGFDLMQYFGTLIDRMPDTWQEEVAVTQGYGLQTDFRFDATGKNNTAVRRLKYNANNTISILR